MRCRRFMGICWVMNSLCFEEEIIKEIDNDFNFNSYIKIVYFHKTLFNVESATTSEVNHH